MGWREREKVWAAASVEGDQLPFWLGGDLGDRAQLILADCLEDEGSGLAGHVVVAFVQGGLEHGRVAVDLILGRVFQGDEAVAANGGDADLPRKVAKLRLHQVAVDLGGLAGTFGRLTWR